jgi:hypothetical protein
MCVCMPSREEVTQCVCVCIPEKKPVMRTAGGKKWEDASLDDWPKDDYRMFCGNLGTY